MYSLARATLLRKLCREVVRRMRGNLPFFPTAMVRPRTATADSFFSSA